MVKFLLEFWIIIIWNLDYNFNKSKWLLNFPSLVISQILERGTAEQRKTAKHDQYSKQFKDSSNVTIKAGLARGVAENKPSKRDLKDMGYFPKQRAGKACNTGKQLIISNAAFRTEYSLPGFCWDSVLPHIV